MTKPPRFKPSSKSPVILTGLFCLLCLVSGCRSQTNPADVTLMFWTALSENNHGKAKKYSIAGSEYFFDKKLQNAHVLTGKVEINFDEAIVETFIYRQSPASGSTFNTYLIRIQKSDHWRVDYKRTLDNIDETEFKNLFQTIREAGKEAIQKTKEKLWPKIEEKGKAVIEKIKNWFKKLFG